MPNQPAPRPRLIIFDLDGVVYRGDDAVPGAADLIDALRRDGRLVRFATNNSMATRDEYADRLHGHGIATDREDIVTSTSATVAHLNHHLPTVRRVLALGAAGLLSELREGGIEATPAEAAAPAEWNGGPLPGSYDAVVAGLDQQIDYRRLGIAAVAIRAGARFIATNADVRYPTPDGFVPGAGAIVRALEVTSGVAPIVIGKPQPAMFQAMLEHASVPPAEALVIGDNPDSDVIAAHRAGIPSILVLTGVADAHAAEKLEGERRPDYTVEGPAAVAELLGVALR